MKPKAERNVAGLMVGALLLAWFGVVLLLYYVPRLAAYWADTDAELSLPARMLLQVGDFANRSIFLIGLLFVATLAAVVWRVAAVRKVRRMNTG